MRDRLLVLGGTRISCDIIRKAQQMGYTVAVTDYNSVENSPGKQIADEHYLVSCTDVDAVVKLIKEKQIGGVITGFSDMLLPYYAEICEKSCLPCYATKEQFELFVDKRKYKALCREYGVPVVEEYPIKDLNYDESMIKFPVLVKPTDDSGSRGLQVCSNNEELRTAVKRMIDKGKQTSFIVERFMGNPEVMIHWIFRDGECYLASIANRHVKNINGDQVIPALVGFTMPSAVLPKYHMDIEEKAKKMFKAAGVRNGIMFMQCKLEDDTCYVFDIGYRLTGSLEYHILEKMCGYNSLEMMIRFAMTGCMGNDDEFNKVTPFFDGYGFSVVCQSGVGTIASVEGTKSIREMDSITNVYQGHVVGDEISSKMLGTLAQVVFRIHGTVESKEDLFAIMKKVYDEIHIISTEGNEMKLPGIEEHEVMERVL